MKAGKRFISGLLLVWAIYAIAFFAGPVFAGSLEPSTAPAPTMHTLEEIYNKLIIIEQKIAAVATGGTGTAATYFTSSTATSFGATKVDLAWTAKGASPDAYNIYRSVSSGTLGTKIATTTGTTFEDSGLTAGTTYYYKIESVAAGGSGVQSQQVTATTGSVPSFPAPVTGMTAVRNGNVITLSWDNYNGAAYYDLYRTIFPDIPCGTWGSMTDIGGPFVTSINDTIAGNGRYTYCVGVSDSTQSQSAFAQVTLDVPAGTLPGVEAPLLDSWSSDKDSSVVHLYWWAAPGAGAHHVYAAPQASGSGPPPITPKQGGTGSALDSGPTAIPIYQVRPGYYGMDIPLSRLSSGYTWFAVEAVKGSYAADSRAIGILVAAPAPVGVTNVRTEPRNPTSLKISWDPAEGAASYKIYRLGSPAETISSANLITTTSATTYLNTGLTQDTKYYYRITAIAAGQGGGAESAPSDYAVGKTLSSTAPQTWQFPPFLIPFMGQAVLEWSGHNLGTTFKIYGGAAFIPTAIDSNNLVVSTILDPLTGVSAWKHLVSMPLEVFLPWTSVVPLPAYGRYWVAEVYPDGTESDKTAFIPFVF